MQMFCHLQQPIRCSAGTGAACAASQDVTEAAPLLPEDPSPEPAPEEELPLGNASVPALDLCDEVLTLAHQKICFNPLFDMFLF